MLTIKSRDNERFKLARLLLKSKYRNKEKKYIAEGLRTIELALEYGAKIEYVFIDRQFSKNSQIIERLEKNTKVFVLDDVLFKQITTTENSQGIIAIIEKNEIRIDDFNSEKHKRIVVLDRIQDPGNLGTIIRTADALGYNLIVLTKGCVDLYNPKVVRSAMGSMFYMDIACCEQEKALEILRNNNIQIISSYLETKNNFEDMKYSSKTAIVVGNEANGINEYWIENSDLLIKIPMFGKAESLNVAISTALLMNKIK